MKIAVAGASGFVGRALIERLRAEHQIIALSRRPVSAAAGVEPRACDLFSLLDAENGVEGAEVAFYLVHSMLPSARLTQGRFEDFDLIAADNFARACAKHGVKQIVYLGGLQPQPGWGSKHLESRLEVEAALGGYGVPVTTLRAGLVIGRGNSGFMMLERLVRRLPVMALPAWTATPNEPVALRDVVELLARSVGRADCLGRSFDIGCGEVVTYRELLTRTARLLGKRPLLIPVRYFSPGFSRLWVSLVTGASRGLVAPLIESLRCPIVCRDHALQGLLGVVPQSLDDALAGALTDTLAGASGERADGAVVAVPVAYKKAAEGDNEVRSVQRMALPAGRTAEWVASEYLRVLPRLVFGAVRVDVAGAGPGEVDKGEVCRFRLWGLGTTLLELTRSPKRSVSDRQLFYVTGGLLARPAERGRLEFREVGALGVMLSAIHEFRPSLPWPIYVMSQAWLHVWVMHRFDRHLRSTRGGG